MATDVDVFSQYQYMHPNLIKLVQIDNSIENLLEANPNLHPKEFLKICEDNGLSRSDIERYFAEDY